jgi:hypothetical protein
MAKISARGAKEVARLAAVSLNDVRYLFVLRSDGKVLRRMADGEGGNTGYQIFGTLRKGAVLEAATLQRIVERRSYKIVK